MNTANQYGLDFERNLLVNSLNKPDKSAAIWKFTGGYNFIDYLSTRKSPATKTTGVDGKFEKAIMGSNEIVAQVASNSASGSNLKLTFTDPNFELFRVQDVIGDMSANNYQGLVVAKGKGYVVLEIVSPITAWNTSTHFTAGTFCTYLFSAAPNRGSGTMQSLYQQPTYVSNQTSVMHDSLTLYANDFNETWMKDYNNGIWGFAQEDLFMEKVTYALEMRALFSSLGTNINSQIGGTTNFSMGLKQSIKDQQRGGIYAGLTSPMTVGMFETWIGQIADRQAVKTITIPIGVGRGALNQIQHFSGVTSSIQYGGKLNTFGGAEVKGFDVMQYAINGINCEFTMLPFLNDKKRFPTLSSVTSLSQYTRMQYTMIALDLNDYESQNGIMLPAMEKKYFGQKETIIGYVPGLIGNANAGKSDVFTSGNVFATNSRDAVSLEFYTNCCYDFMSYRMGWLEMAV